MGSVAVAVASDSVYVPTGSSVIVSGGTKSAIPLPAGPAMTACAVVPGGCGSVMIKVPVVAAVGPVEL